MEDINLNISFHILDEFISNNEIKELEINNYLLYEQLQMNKSHIDFFSTGLNNKKARLSVNIFSLDAQHHASQGKQPRKTSISAMTFSRNDKKDISENKVSQNNNGDLNIFYNTFSWMNSAVTLPSKKKIIKQQNQLSHFPSLSLHKINNRCQIDLNNKVNIKSELNGDLRIINKQIFRGQKFTKITQQVENIETQLDKLKQENSPKTYLSHQNKRKIIAEGQNQQQNQQIERKKYFINNLMFQNTLALKNGLSRKYSEHKFVLKKNIIIDTGTPNYQSQKNQNKIIFLTQRKQINKRLAKQRYSVNKQDNKIQQSKEINPSYQKRKKKILKLPMHTKFNDTKLECQNLINRWEVAKQQSQDYYI